MKQPGLDRRHRDRDGEIDRKRSDTRIDTLRRTYGSGFAPGLSGDKTLGDLRAKTGRSLSDSLKKQKK
jgi:hypothetical protein